MNFENQIAAIATGITAEGGLVELHFDVESTSLRGAGFAFGGFVRQGDRVLAEFALISKEGAAQASEWVQENILPHLGDLPTVATQKELRRSFWELYATTKAAVIAAHGCKPWELVGRFVVVGDNLWPVEASFLLAAHDDAIARGEAGEFDGPYMPIDITSALAALGYDPDLPRVDAAGALGVGGVKHDPRADAVQSAAVYDAARRGDPVLDKHRL